MLHFTVPQLSFSRTGTPGSRGVYSTIISLTKVFELMQRQAYPMFPAINPYAAPQLSHPPWGHWAGYGFPVVVYSYMLTIYLSIKLTALECLFNPAMHPVMYPGAPSLHSLGSVSKSIIV